MAKPARYEVVSSESENLILVDESDQVLGHESKANCHDGEGILHRAFSLFIFNDSGELLLQQRSHEKRLWPGYWSNSCCSHPRAGETMDVAAERRLRQELGMGSSLRYVYKFSYHARFGDEGSERELCSVYLGHSADPVRANVSEVADWRWILPRDLDQELASHPERFTPWFKMEWEELKSNHSTELARLSA